VAACCLVGLYDFLMEAVLVLAPCIFASVHPCLVCLVFTELDLLRILEMNRISAERSMLGDDGISDQLERRLLPGREPGPVVPEPDLRQDMNAGFVGPAIVDGDP